MVLVHSHCATVTAIHLHNISSQSLYSFNTHSRRLLAATILFCLWGLLKVLYINVIRQCLSFCDWLIWLNHPQGSSIHTVACVGISFLKLSNILLYVCMYIYTPRFVNPFIRGWTPMASTFWLLWIWVCTLCLSPCFQIFWVYTQHWNCWAKDNSVF